MTSQEVAEAVVAWARAEIPALKVGYPYPPGITDLLPDVAAVVQGIRTVDEDPENFPTQGLEQVWLKVFDIEVSIMVPQDDGAEGEKVAHQTLEGFAETLVGSTLSDVTLGGRLTGAFASPRMTVDLGEYEPRDDGTRGREMPMTMAVAEPFELEL